VRDGYRKVHPKGCSGEVQVWGPGHRIHVPLTLFARELPKKFAETTTRGYLNEVLRIHNRLENDPIVTRQGWSLFGSVDEVRNAIEHILQAEYGCVVRSKTDETDQHYLRVIPGDKTPASASHLMAGLNFYYEVIGKAGLYLHGNPMQTVDGREKIQQYIAQARAAHEIAHGRSHVHAISGVDLPLEQKRLTTSFFRLNAGKWVPEVINDPNLPSHVYKAGEHAGWSLRERCVVRILFEAGPRIHEVFELDMADWKVSAFKNIAASCSKGSNSARVKKLVFSPQTAKVLRRYVNMERAAHDPIGRTLADFERMSQDDLRGIPLFLTARGERMTPDAFRRFHWTPALTAYGLAMRIHQARHWFVTRQLEDIRKGEKDPTARRIQEDLLVEYMAWRSGREMLDVYGHVLREGDAISLIEKSHRRMAKQEKLFYAGKMTPIPKARSLPEPDLEDINPLLLEIYQEGADE
jgi:hypothetical protein